MTPALTALLPSAADAELEDWGPLPEATGHPMAVHGVELWVDGDASAGIWQCTPGPVLVAPRRERGHLRAVGAHDGHPGRREAGRVGAGDIAVFPLGWTGTWDIHETVRKVYAVF